MSYVTFKLDNIAEINPRLPKGINEEQVVSFISMASVSEAGKIISQEKKTIKSLKKGFTYFERGDVLLAKITPCFENGKATYVENIDSQIGFGSTEFHVLRPNTELVNPKYLFYLVWNEKFRFLAEKKMTGSAGQKRVPVDYLRNYEVKLPTLEQQDLIVKTLDKSYEIKRKRIEAVKIQQELLNAIFFKMFGDPIINNKNWNTKPLGDVIKLSSGTGLIAKAMDQDGIYPVYGGNGITGYHSEYMFSDPQLTIGRVGVYCGKIHITKPNSWVTDNALYVKKYLCDTNIHYLSQLLEILNLNQFAGRAAQPLVSGSRIYPIEAIFPPIEEQNKFEHIKKEILFTYEVINSSQNSIEEFIGSLSRSIA
ncbi:restriction endonuclease subunit S [Erwinia typographi]|uniref:restriction endonuclease subunit S n=1 Tax=Erwinia typographi TaxID=371042 RepID=UPI00068988FA|nr:restriction endonuclease subunit S [Erwinia typographi]